MTYSDPIDVPSTLHSVPEQAAPTPPAPPAQVDDEPASPDAAAQEVAQLDKSIEGLSQQAQMIAARRLFLTAWLRGRASNLAPEAPAT